MISFLEYTDSSFLQAKLAELGGISLLNILLGRQYNWQNFKPSSVQELEQNLSSEGDLFGSANSELKVISLENFNLSPDLLFNLCQELNASDDEIIVHQGLDGSLNAEMKKIWTGYKFKYDSIKKADPKIKQNLFDEYAKELGLKLNSGHSKSLIEQTLNYSEIIDSLDFIDLSENPEVALKSHLVTQKQLPFMLGFNMNRLNSDIQNWYSQIDDDDIQLALSLIYTKLDKQKDPKVPKLMSKLVRMDQRIKTSNKAPGSTWWKYFLWEAKNS